MSRLSDLLVALEGTDFYTIVLPFLLVFAIVYGALLAIGIFSENNAVNAIIALVVALFFIQEEALYGNVSNFLAGIMGPYSIFLILGVLLVIPLAIGGKKPGDIGNKYVNIAVLLVLGTAIIILQQGGVNRVFGDVMELPAVPELAGVDIFTLGIILFVGLAFYWMVFRE